MLAHFGLVLLRRARISDAREAAIGVVAGRINYGYLGALVDFVHFADLVVDFLLRLLVYAVPVDPDVLEPESQGDSGGVSNRLWQFVNVKRIRKHRGLGTFSPNVAQRCERLA